MADNVGSTGTTTISGFQDDIAAGATLDLAKTIGSATAGSLAISNNGMILISVGLQTVGAISGAGVTQVNPG